MRKPLAVTLVILLSTAMFAQQPTSDRFQQVASRIVASFNAGDFTAMRNDFSREMLDGIPLEKLAQFSRELSAQVGRIRKLDPPRFPAPGIAIFTTSFMYGATFLSMCSVAPVGGCERGVGRFPPGS